MTEHIAISGLPDSQCKKGNAGCYTALMIKSCTKIIPKCKIHRDFNENLYIIQDWIYILVAFEKIKSDCLPGYPSMCQFHRSKQVGF
jgi:hypothetical protein